MWSDICGYKSDHEKDPHDRARYDDETQHNAVYN